MRRLVFFSLLLVLMAAPLGADEPLLQGFTKSSSPGERQWEQKFRALPSPQLMRDYMQRLSARPHHVGSPYDKANAEWILSKFKEFGWDAHIETFDVLFPTPKERLVEMIEPTKFTAKLQEPPVAGDPTSGQTSEQLPTYNAYSIDGDVTAPLVFVNYGLPKDYDQLQRLGISVKGAIVIAKYGNSWRGVKPMVAGEHGAIGCIIYSDPRDDGYFEDNVFPEGPTRPAQGVQRGSVMDFASSNPGDPLTPGIGATPNAKRLSVKEAPSISKIPVLPISYGDARPLLAALQGPVAPESWRGSLPITYHVGPGPAKVHLVVKSNWDIKPVNDVIAKIAGTQPEEWIVRGNHHDGWVNGADDPISAQVALLEEARALGQLRKQGWKPKRTIIYAAWDGEEPMLLGSTEWAEEHADELRQHAVAYINTDGNGRGYLMLEGSHTLEHFMNGVARDVQDPESGVSVWQRDELHSIAQAKSDEDRKKIRDRADLRMGALGSGTDYTTFVDHLGVASLNLGYGGEDQDAGIYHSIYDDFYWYTHFSDTSFVYGRALSQTVGTAVMRLADADLLPFDFTDFSDTMQLYLTQLKKLAQDKRSEAVERDRELDEGLFHAINDPRRPTVAPPREPVPPYLNFAPLENAVAQLNQSAQRYQEALQKAWASPQGVPAATLADLNQKMMESERRLTDDAGLPRRPWYKHMIYAPGVYTGYGVKTMPGVREAIEQKRWPEADAEIIRISKVLENESGLIDSATAELTGTR